ncbi:MAG: hypothetical protein ACK4MI_09805 [Brevundimonas sp.]|uniref:hypothetical protein n=1 Tax=Brevundimonas sp. TaxID=1871086 RepID=UPI00391CCC7A
MRRALVLTTVLTAAAALAGTAAAQSAAPSTPVNGAGLRYLSWPGKPPVGARLTPAPAPVPVPVSRTLPLARLAPPPSAAPAPAPAPIPDAPTRAASVETPRRGLTPATAWTGQSPLTNPSPQNGAQPGVQAGPQAYPTAMTPPAPASATAPVMTPVAAEPAPYHPAPDQVAARQPAPTPLPAPEAAAPASQPPAPQPAYAQASQAEAAPVQAQQAEAPQPQAADPMAPRRDAPIYRLMRPQTGVALDGAAVAGAQQAAQLAPGEQTARYYSVHRQAGRHPDAIPAPQPTYLDALPVQMTQTPQSTDLAQPDGPPALIRNANGALRAVPQTQADDLP